MTELELLLFVVTQSIRHHIKKGDTSPSNRHTEYLTILLLFFQSPLPPTTGPKTTALSAHTDAATGKSFLQQQQQHRGHVHCATPWLRARCPTTLACISRVGRLLLPEKKMRSEVGCETPVN